MILFLLKLSTLSCSSGLYVLPRIQKHPHMNTKLLTALLSKPSQHLLVLSLIKKSPRSFIILDLHTNSVHIKQLLQKVGGLMNATVSSVLTQFFLIHIQLCAPSQLPHDPPLTFPPPSGTAILFLLKCFLQPLPKSQNPLH